MTTHNGDGEHGKIELVISMRRDGRGVNVTGPIANRVLCYGMLEMARDAIRDWKPVDAPSIVLPNTPLAG